MMLGVKKSKQKYSSVKMTEIYHVFPVPSCAAVSLDREI